MAKYSIADFKHRLVVCSVDDVVNAPDSISLVKKGMYAGNAVIETKRSQTFAANGTTFQDKQKQVSHRITMNYRPDVEISNAAWLYEERRLSAPRWFKVVAVREESGNDCFVFDCRLTERSDDAAPPSVAPDDETGLFGLVPIEMP